MTRWLDDEPSLDRTAAWAAEAAAYTATAIITAHAAIAAIDTCLQG